jgi:hypothetical protein
MHVRLSTTSLVFHYKLHNEWFMLDGNKGLRVPDGNLGSSPHFSKHMIEEIYVEKKS